jgi:SP family xylose:H+ symportor-like MFS transporter
MKHAKVSAAQIQAITGTTFVATLSSLLFGYATAVVAGAVGAIRHNYIEPRALSDGMADALLGFTVCSALLGTISGALIARPLAGWLGRKRPMILAGLLFMISAVGSAYPEIGFAALGGTGHDAIWAFISYRILGGIAVGIASVIAPMYVGEFAPSAVRGQLGAYQQIAIIGGMTIAYLVNWGITLQGSDTWVLDTGWRWMMLALAAPAAAFFYLSFSVPESPRWLVKTGRIEEARRQLGRSMEPEEARALIEKLASENSHSKPAPLFTYGKRVVFVGIALSVFQQLVGINAVSYYGPAIFAEMGYHMNASFLATLIASMVNFMVTMIVVLVVDKVGRKPLLIVGGLVSGLSMLWLGSAFDAQQADAYGLIATCCFMVGFALSFGPIVWIMMTELFPAPIRGQALSVAVASQWVANLLVSASFPLLMGNGWLNAAWNHGFAFWLYGGFAILAAFVVVRYVPETRGVDGEQLVVLWRREDLATQGATTRA